MPYLVLAIGAIIGGIALYRFFLRADAAQVKAALLALLGLGIAIASLFLAVTGRLPAAIAILIALWPLVLAWLRHRKTEPSQPSDTMAMTGKEALDILGLTETATADDIRAAHIRLMKKVHPDQEGTEWLAKKINTAKDLLLKSRV